MFWITLCLINHELYNKPNIFFTCLLVFTINMSSCIIWKLPNQKCMIKDCSPRRMCKLQTQPTTTTLILVNWHCTHNVKNWYVPWRLGSLPFNKFSCNSLHHRKTNEISSRRWQSHIIDLWNQVCDSSLWKSPPL
jgi:hypothetical protein